MNSAAEAISKIAATPEKIRVLGRNQRERSEIPRRRPFVKGMSRADTEFAIRDVRGNLSYLSRCRAPFHARTRYWTELLVELKAHYASFPPVVFKPKGLDEPVVRKRKPEPIPGESKSGGGTREVPFETVQECRRLYEVDKVPKHVICYRYGLKAATLDQWLRYTNRVHR